MTLPVDWTVILTFWIFGPVAIGFLKATDVVSWRGVILLHVLLLAATVGTLQLFSGYTL